jgi:hypothetical protein
VEVAGPAGVPAPQAAGGAARRFRLASPVTANVLGIAGVALFIAALPLAAVTRNLTVSSAGANIATIPVFLAYGAVGLVVARHQPRNPMGWILLGFAVLLAASNCAGAYTALIYRFGHGTLPLGPAAVLLDLLWAPAIVLASLAVPLFPDGTLPSLRWRWVLRAYLLIGACWLVSIYTVAIATIAGHHIRVDAGGNLAVIDQPAGSAAWLTPAQELILPVLVVFSLVFIGRQAASFRRSSDERRQQLKWLLSGAGACLLGGAVVLLIPALDTHMSAIAQAAIALGAVVTLAFPISIGVGVLKYRLYDIDRIISRTVAYAIVTGLLVGVYAGLVLLATQVLTIKSPVAVAGSTLAAAALFNPVRRRVQQAVDRRFNRARYDADQTVAAFASRLKDAVDLDSVRDDLAGVVHQALEPAHVSVWISQRD